jgi:hypothetical protein
MYAHTDIPAEKYWEQIREDRQMHPYAMYKMVNRDTVEVVASAPSGDASTKRFVLVKNGAYEVWVKTAEQQTYGYPLDPQECVSETELEAITLKHAALRDGANVAVSDAKALIDAGESDQLHHALIGLYYAAKADTDIPSNDVAKIRDLMHDQTGHVDTNHKPTLQRILNDTDTLAK